MHHAFIILLHLGGKLLDCNIGSCPNWAWSVCTQERVVLVSCSLNILIGPSFTWKWLTESFSQKKGNDRGDIRLEFEVCNAILPMFNSGQNLLHPKRKKVQSLSIIIKNDWLAKGDVLNYIGRWVAGRAEIPKCKGVNKVMCTGLSSASAQAASLRPDLLVPPTWFKTAACRRKPQHLNWSMWPLLWGPRLSFQLHFSSSALEQPALRLHGLSFFHTYSHDFSLPVHSLPPGSSPRVLPCFAPISLEDTSNVFEGLTLPMDGKTVMEWDLDF